MVASQDQVAPDLAVETVLLSLKTSRCEADVLHFLKELASNGLTEVRGGS